MVLLQAGITLADLDAGRTDWADVCAVLLTAVKTVGSVLDRALRPTEHIWDSNLQLLRQIEFRLRHLEWTVVKALGGRGDEPEPMPMGKADDQAEAVDIDVMDDWLKNRR